MKIGNLNEVEAWKGGGGLTVGTHDVVCIRAEETESSKGNPQIELEFEAIRGEEQGGTIRDWIVVIPATLGKVKGFMEACGVAIPEGEFNLNVSDIVGSTTRIVVRKENPDDKYPKVVGYSATDATVSAAASTGAADPAADKIPF